MVIQPTKKNLKRIPSRRRDSAQRWELPNLVSSWKSSTIRRAGKPMDGMMRWWWREGRLTNGRLEGELVEGGRRNFGDGNDVETPPFARLRHANRRRHLTLVNGRNPPDKPSLWEPRAVWRCFPERHRVSRDSPLAGKSNYCRYYVPSTPPWGWAMVLGGWSWASLHGPQPILNLTHGQYSFVIVCSVGDRLSIAKTPTRSQQRQRAHGDSVNRRRSALAGAGDYQIFARREIPLG